jgi:hypothetical protein
MPVRKDRAMLRSASVAIAAAALALAPAAPAGAKEPTSAQACDADLCNTVTNKGALRALQEQAPAKAPQRAAPFYRVRTTISAGPDEEFRFTTAYVPSLRLLRDYEPATGYLWLTPSPRATRVLERLTRGLEPIPARRLRGVATDAPSTNAATPPAPPGDGGGMPWFLILVPVVVVAGGAWAARQHRLHLRPT